MTTQINAAEIDTRIKTEIDERRRRLLRFGTELDRRGVPYRIARPPSDHWRLRVHGMHRDVTVFCAGAEETYVLVTADGRILAPADPPGCRSAADLLTAITRPTQTRWAS